MTLRLLSPPARGGLGAGLLHHPDASVGPRPPSSEPDNSTGLFEETDVLSSTPLPALNMVTGFKAYGQASTITIPAAGDTLTFEIPNNSLDVAGVATPEPGTLALMAGAALVATRRSRWLYRKVAPHATTPANR